MRLLRALPAAAVAVALLAGCTAAAQHAGAGRSTAPGGPAIAGKPCHLPGDMRAGPGRGAALNGPAVTELTGGAVSGGFSLDGGKFSIMPPPVGAVPRVSRTLAECEALGAVASDGEPFSEADEGSGMAVGYGLATVAAALPVRSWRGHYPGITLPTPAPADYQSRLSWVAVFRIFDWLNCPGVTSTTAPSAGGRYAGYYYEVFIIDAATGGDAVTYDEAVPDQCHGPGLSAPGVSIPVELTSVRWKLDRRGPRDAYATLTAYVPACLDYYRQATPGVGTDLVTVLAYGQVAASCGGSPRPVTVRVEPVFPGRIVSPGLVHAATGLYLYPTGSAWGFVP